MLHCHCCGASCNPDIGWMGMVTSALKSLSMPPLIPIHTIKFAELQWVPYIAFVELRQARRVSDNSGALNWFLAVPLTVYSGRGLLVLRWVVFTCTAAVWLANPWLCGLATRVQPRRPLRNPLKRCVGFTRLSLSCQVAFMPPSMPPSM